MSSSKPRYQPGSRRQTRERLHLAKEIGKIQRRAADQDMCIVSIGPLVSFSTSTGDAWMLESADRLAVRLACGGDPLAVQIAETEDRFAIGWQGHYRFDNDAFVFEDNESGRVTAIRGYPVQPLQRAIGAA